MLVKQLGYLTALARFRHFGRAAEACGISQPALSAALRQIEAELGVRIIERARRFKGFTPEGQLVLDWSQRLVHDFDALRQDLGVFKHALAGRLRLGIIPAALPAIGLLTAPFAARHPEVTLGIHSLSSKEIEREIDSFDLDLGLTYLDNEPLSRVRSLPLYRERFCLIAPKDSRFKGRRQASWAEAAEERLILLNSEMQNRRIIDRIFAGIGKKPRPAIEADSLLTLVSQVTLGRWSSIVPASLLLLIEAPHDILALPLTEPAPSHIVGLVYAERDPVPGLIRAFLAVAKGLKLKTRIDALATLPKEKPADGRR